MTALARPGAILAFQEHARAGLPAGLEDLALHRKLYDWNWNTVAAEEGDVGLALRLPELMQKLGLSVEEAHGEAILLNSNQPSFLPTLMQAMLPRIVERGIATVEQIDPDTLAQRIENEHRAVGGTIVWDLAFSVAARVQSASGGTCAFRRLRARAERRSPERDLPGSFAAAHDPYSDMHGRVVAVLLRTPGNTGTAMHLTVANGDPTGRAFMKR